MDVHTNQQIGVDHCSKRLDFFEQILEKVKREVEASKTMLATNVLAERRLSLHQWRSSLPERCA